MDVLPENWIDKIFEFMDKQYGVRWSRQFKTPFELSLYKTLWYNALNGLSVVQLRHGLIVTKKYAKFKDVKPPHHIKFYHYCIKTIYPDVPRRTWKPKR